jgi:hypothetical protein
MCPRSHPYLGFCCCIAWKIATWSIVDKMNLDTAITIICWQGQQYLDGSVTYCWVTVMMQDTCGSTVIMRIWISQSLPVDQYSRLLSIAVRNRARGHIARTTWRIAVTDIISWHISTLSLPIYRVVTLTDMAQRHIFWWLLRNLPSNTLRTLITIVHGYDHFDTRCIVYCRTKLRAACFVLSSQQHQTWNTVRNEQYVIDIFWRQLLTHLPCC